MRKLRKGIFIETRFEGVLVGAIRSKDGMLLVDCPLLADSVREWLGQLAPHGQSKYAVLLDHHPDRVLGARVLDLPLIAQEQTLQAMREWPDAFKGSSKPIGAAADQLKRITGVTRAVPDLAFSDEMVMHLGEREIRIVHRPGPNAGATWVFIPDAEIVFVGDAVSVSQPPYFGDADIEQWMERLDELRSPDLANYHIVSARDGLVKRDQLNQMARFLRKVPSRLKKIADKGMSADAASSVAHQLLRDFQYPQSQRDLLMRRLESGLRLLYARSFSNDK
jgi:glyoxylase-like metal-dependent hydrolase (beta-lactamase superfamily II)